jgi:hypothetical protein
MMPVVDESGSTYFELGILDKVENLYPDYLKDIEFGDLSRPGVASERYFSDVFVDSFCRNFHRFSLPKVRIWVMKSVGKCKVCDDIDTMKKTEKGAAKASSKISLALALAPPPCVRRCTCVCVDGGCMSVYRCE